MGPDLKDTLEHALMQMASEGPRHFDQLKVKLMTRGIAQVVLDENRYEIMDMYMDCIRRHGNGMSLHDRAFIIKGPVPPLHTNIPPLEPPLELPARSSWSTLTKSATQSSNTDTYEEGWIKLIDIPSRAREDVFFSFSTKPGNVIGEHVLLRYGKRIDWESQDENIELICHLESHPRRTYTVNFRVAKSKDFDVLLGRGWDEPSWTGSVENNGNGSRKESYDQSDERGKVLFSLPECQAKLD